MMCFKHCLCTFLSHVKNTSISISLRWDSNLRPFLMEEVSNQPLVQWKVLDTFNEKNDSNTLQSTFQWCFAFRRACTPYSKLPKIDDAWRIQASVMVNLINPETYPSMDVHRSDITYQNKVLQLQKPNC